MEFIGYIMIGLFIVVLFQKLVPTKGVRQISVTELKNQMSAPNKQFIDVRTVGEFKTNNIRGFKNIPLQQLNKKMSELSKDKEVVVICQSGMRSNQASKLLKKNGFKQVANVKGGMSAL
ncbi:rhodanese-like domain-containing protein [Bacillus sp. SCS-151]|uniref:rhodanese-like domain-containing protein n=1 Tax=Nanhaiella sioensis TaxID=3115293 RepID=UPI00397B01BC